MDCTVFLRGNSFINSSTKSSRGCAISITKEFSSTSNTDPNDKPIEQANIQYCCFSKCTLKSKDLKHIGMALFLCLKNTILYYSSIVDCPNNDYLNHGALVDIQAETVRSKFLNITGGKSTYCAGIEYRRVTAGFFSYQTISNIETCMFATSFSDVSNELEISNTVYTNISLKKKYSDDPNYKDESLTAGVIHLSYSIIKVTNQVNEIHFFHISYFYFFKINDIDTVKKEAKLVSRGTRYYNNIYYIQKINITLNNCFVDGGFDVNNVCLKSISKTMMLYGDVEQNADLTPIPIDQLDLEDCKGAIKPPGLTLEPIVEPTPSVIFTKSQYFSNTNDFSQSSDFTKSTYFSESSDFTKSTLFSESSDFTKSIYFSESSDFTKSSLFMGTDKFSKSFAFTGSRPFTLSDDLLGTTRFTKSSIFTNSAKFSESDDFSNSFFFTKSSTFSPSNTKKLSSTEIFSASDHEILILIHEMSNQNVKFGTGKAIGIAAAAIWLFKRKKNFNDMSAEVAACERAEDVHYDSPLYGKSKLDDPFAEDFDEQVRDVYIV